jgi:thioredoxin 1
METLLIVSAIIALVVIYLIYQYRKIKNTPVTEDHPDVLHLNDKNFSSQTAKGVVLVDFWAAWCMPCKMIAPIVNELAHELKGTAGVGKLNVDENPAISQKYGVRSIPTMIVLKNGKEVERIVGGKSKAVLKKAIEKYL